MNKYQFNICIIGAGVVGLAIAEKLSNYFNDIIVIEKESTFGQHISSRNSEVIHSGFYYPKDSLKQKLCVKGNKLLYNFLDKYKIKHKNCGKLIVANTSEEIEKLDNIFLNAKKNNVDATILNSKEVSRVEPQVNCLKSLWIPSAGIVDSHGLMSKLEYLSASNNVSLLYNNMVTSIKFDQEGYILYLNNNECIQSNIVINAAGLWSEEIAKMVGLDKYKIEFYKGDYYKCNSIKDLNCLVYPIPDILSLGVHSVLGLDGAVSFGPNIYKVDKIDYSIDDRYKEQYFNQISKIFDIKTDDIYPDFSGIRPKIEFTGDFNDFKIYKDKINGYNTFINLIGIDSPGLTSCLAISDYVFNLIQE